MLDLYFVNTQLRKLCSSEKELIRKFGERRGRLVAIRLSELLALPNLATAHKVRHLGLHQLKAGRDETFALKVVDPYRIVLEPAETPVPRRDDGGVALDLVTAVVVLEIIDYH